MPNWLKKSEAGRHRIDFALSTAESDSEESEMKSDPPQPRESSVPGAQEVPRAAPLLMARKAVGGKKPIRGTEGEESMTPTRHPNRDRRSASASASAASQASMTPTRHPNRDRRAASASSQKSDSSRASSTAPVQGTKKANSSTPDAINERGRFNGRLQSNPVFKKLRLACQSRWNRKYDKRLEKDPDTRVVDYAVDHEVRTRSSEGAAAWDVQWKKSGADSFEIDYVVGTIERKPGDALPSDVLIKYFKYPMPSWGKTLTSFDCLKSSATNECLIRLHDLDFIEVRLRAQYGDAKFLQLYPNRYLKEEVGEGNGGYVKDARSQYVNRLRSIEWRWKYACDRSGLPPVYVEDWTDEPMADDDLALLQFLCDLRKSDAVRRLLCEYRQLEELHCQPGCGQCSSKTLRYMKRCCGSGPLIDIDEKTGDFAWRDKGRPATRGHDVQYECISLCGCGKECKNRYLQKGRQCVLCVFREPEKGWGVRVVQELDKCTYVDEYVGEVQVSREAGPYSIYDFDMSYCPKGDNGEDLPKLVIDAGQMGNATRFFNHSCDANMNALRTIIERHGRFFHHIGFFSTRKIMPGEELTFDYFPDKDTSSLDMRMMFKDGCRCNSMKCRFPAGPVNASRHSDDGNEDDMEDTMGDDNDDELDRTLVASPPPPASRRGHGDRRSSNDTPSTAAADRNGRGKQWMSEEREVEKKVKKDRRGSIKREDSQDGSGEEFEERDMNEEEWRGIETREQRRTKEEQRRQMKKRQVDSSEDGDEESMKDDDRQKQKRAVKRSRSRQQESPEKKIIIISTDESEEDEKDKSTKSRSSAKDSKQVRKRRPQDSSDEEDQKERSPSEESASQSESDSSSSSSSVPAPSLPEMSGTSSDEGGTSVGRSLSSTKPSTSSASGANSESTPHSRNSKAI